MEAVWKQNKAWTRLLHGNGERGIQTWLEQRQWGGVEIVTSKNELGSNFNIAETPWRKYFGVCFIVIEEKKIS